MQSDIETVALVILSALAAACSATPHTAGGNAPMTEAPAPQGSAAAPSGSVDASLVKAGYSVMRRQGEIYYCRNEVITGQRIGTRICLTAGQIQDEKQNVIKAKDLMNQPSYRCVGASCAN